MLIDSHVHLNNDKFLHRIKEVVEAAKQEKVEKFIVVGFDKITNKLAVELADKYDEIYATVGWHPVDATYATEQDFLDIEAYLKNPKVVGIGECGLDYHWDTSTKEEQFYVFKKQIELSKKYNKPLVIHMRDATQDTYDLLKQEGIGAMGGVMHCYSGSNEMADEFIKLGLYISLGGPVTFKNGQKAKEVAKHIPIDKLLIETDSPYLAPHPFRGKVNEPKYVALVAKEIAKLREMEYDKCCNQITKNTMRLFNLKGAKL